jgi:hypothetical protein
MKKVLIHQPYKYGDFIYTLAAAQKLTALGYEVHFPYCDHTADLIRSIENINFFKIGATDYLASEIYAKQNDCIFINCQFPLGPKSPSSLYLGEMYNDERKYAYIESILKCGLKHEDKYKLTWKRDLQKENKLISLLKLDLNEKYDICHLVRDSNAIQKLPFQPNYKMLHIDRIEGFSLFDWYPIIANAKRVFAVQSSAQCFIDCIKNHLNHNELYLLNDPSEHDRQAISAKGWKLDFFIKKRLVLFDMNGNSLVYTLTD